MSAQKEKREAAAAMARSVEYIISNSGLQIRQAKAHRDLPLLQISYNQLVDVIISAIFAGKSYQA